MSGFGGYLKLECTSVSSKSNTSVFLLGVNDGRSNALCSVGERCADDWVVGVYLTLCPETPITVGVSSPYLTYVMRAIC